MKKVRIRLDDKTFQTHDTSIDKSTFYLLDSHNIFNNDESKRFDQIKPKPLIWQTSSSFDNN